MATETIYERWKRDTGFGTTPSKAWIESEHPRDPHTGEWIEAGGRIAGPLFDPSQGVGVRRGKPLEGLPPGIRSGPIGDTSTITSKDADGIIRATSDVVKKFPELTKPKKKGWKGRSTRAFWGFEFGSDPQDKWTGEITDEMGAMATGGQLVGAGTSPDPETGKIKTAVNDTSYMDGFHGMLHGEAAKSTAVGTRSGPAGEIYHELGHALGWATGVESTEAGSREDTDATWQTLFELHDLGEARLDVSHYGALSPSEAFAELFANYMTGNLSAGDRKNFEGLLTEITGRKVTS